MEQIENGIYYEDSFPGVTLGAVILPQGTLLIDSPLRVEDGRSWKTSIINRGRGTHRLLVVLDANHDRNLGARTLDFPILAHEETAATFQDRTAVFKGQNLETGAEWERFMEVLGTRWVHPTLTFTKKMHILWGAYEIIIEHHPGPMAGSSWVMLPEAKVVFVGDTITGKHPPFLAHANLTAWIESLDLLLSPTYRGFTIVGGRDGLATAKTVRSARSFLKKALKELEKTSQRGASPEAIEKLIPKLLSDFDPPKNLESLYRQRLTYGLQQYYSRTYLPQKTTEDG